MGSLYVCRYTTAAAAAVSKINMMQSLHRETSRGVKAAHKQSPVNIKVNVA